MPNLFTLGSHTETSPLAFNWLPFVITLVLKLDMFLSEDTDLPSTYNRLENAQNRSRDHVSSCQLSFGSSMKYMAMNISNELRLMYTAKIRQAPSIQGL